MSHVHPLTSLRPFNKDSIFKILNPRLNFLHRFWKYHGTESVTDLTLHRTTSISFFTSKIFLQTKHHINSSLLTSKTLSPVEGIRRKVKIGTPDWISSVFFLYLIFIMLFYFLTNFIKLSYFLNDLLECPTLVVRHLQS